jgi:hypothetical protein
MASVVPKKVRVTVIVFGYSFSVGIVGGLAPMLTEFLVGKLHIVMAPAIVIMAAAAVSLLALFLDPAWTKNNERFPEDTSSETIL